MELPVFLSLSLSPATHSRSKWQGDQTLEFKVAKFFTNVAQKVAKQVVNKKRYLKLLKKLPNIWANFVREYASETFQK